MYAVTSGSIIREGTAALKIRLHRRLSTIAKRSYSPKCLVVAFSEVNIRDPA
jgi:hypothetical protein